MLDKFKLQTAKQQKTLQLQSYEAKKLMSSIKFEYNENEIGRLAALRNYWIWRNSIDIVQE